MSVRLEMTGNSSVLYRRLRWLYHVAVGLSGSLGPLNLDLCGMSIEREAALH